MQLVKSDIQAEAEANSKAKFIQRFYWCATLKLKTLL